MNSEFDKYSLSLIDPPEGWSWDNLDIRYENLDYDQVGSVAVSILHLAHKKWLRSSKTTPIPGVAIQKTR